MLARDFLRGDPDEEFTKFFEPLMGGPEAFYDTVKNVQEPGQSLDTALKKYHEKHNIMTCGPKLCVVDPTGFNTMCHGDMWFNNMLFK